MKYFKATLFVIALVTCLVVGIMGWHWTDVAKTKFWWTFWEVAALVCDLGFIGLIYWFASTKNKW